MLKLKEPQIGLEQWFSTRGPWNNLRGFTEFLIIFKFTILELGDMQFRIRFMLQDTILKTESLNARIALYELTTMGVKLMTHLTSLAQLIPL